MRLPIPSLFGLEVTGATREDPTVPAPAPTSRPRWSTASGGWRPSLAAGALAVLAAVTSYLCIRQSPLLWHQDAVQYLSLGEHLARGEGYRSSLYIFHDLLQPPLYPLLIALGIRLGASPETAAIGVCVLAQALTVLAVLALHRVVFGRRGRWMSATVAAVYPGLALASGLTLEALFACLLAFATVLGFTCFRRGGGGRAFACGLLAGLSLLARSEGLVTLVVLGGLLFLRRAPPARRLALPLALAAGAALVLVPYGLWMKAGLGRFEVLPKISYNTTVDDINKHMAWSPEQEHLGSREHRSLHSLMPDHATFILNYAYAHPEFDPRPLFPRRPAPPFLRTLLASLRQVVADGVRNTRLFHPVTLLLALFGFARGLRRGGADGIEDPDFDPAATRLLTLTLAGLAALHVAPAVASGDDYESRYVCAAWLHLVPLVGAGADGLAGWLSVRLGRPGSRAVGVAAGVVLALGFAVASLQLADRLSGSARVQARTRAIEEACGRVIPEGARVMADHSRFAWLRHGRPFQLPYVDTLRELLDYVEHHGIEYAIFDARTLRKNVSRVDRDLVEPATWPPGWTALERVGPTDEPIWIVKLR